MIRMCWLARTCEVLILLGLLSSCKHTTGIQLCNGGVVTDYESIFTKAVSVYYAATNSGLNLDKAGAGRGAISHTSLFVEYKHVFYLPIEGDPLIASDTLPFLNRMLKSEQDVETLLASVCIRIIESEKKLRRTGIQHIELGAFAGDFVVYHYN